MTLADFTPGSFETPRVMSAAQEAQCIPEMVRSVFFIVYTRVRMTPPYLPMPQPQLPVGAIVGPLADGAPTAPWPLIAADGLVGAASWASAPSLGAASWVGDPPVAAACGAAVLAGPLATTIILPSPMPMLHEVR